MTDVVDLSIVRHARSILLQIEPIRSILGSEEMASRLMEFAEAKTDYQRKLKAEVLLRLRND